MNSSPFAPSPEAFLNAYLAERYDLEIERPWAAELPPLSGANAPALPEVPDLPV